MLLVADVVIAASAAPRPSPLAAVPSANIVSTADGHKVALFFTGRQHAGENLEKVLAQRSRELAPPIQMCDALSRNTKGEFDTIVANCLAHGRRQFVDVAGSFPEECRHVLEVLRDVYRNDALAREHRKARVARFDHGREDAGQALFAADADHLGARLLARR